MRRHEFTKNIARILIDMADAGDSPVGDWWLRNSTVQKYLFDKKLSKCDGTIRKSDHQFGCALDIYLSDGKGVIEFDWDEKKSEYWHKVWTEKYGGKPLTIFKDGTKDHPHFN